MSKLFKKESDVHGYGVFASEEISSGKQLIEYCGQRITPIAAQVRDVMYAKSGVSYLFNVNEKIVIDGGVNGNLSRFINHSCDPNCEIKIIDERVFIYSKKFIKKGEEITFDYNFRKDAFREYCNCQSKNCRGFLNRIE
jgi:SET domain-containing protein